MKKRIQQKMYLAIESIEGRTTSEALTSMYINGSETLYGICAKWNINFRTLLKIMDELGINRRSRSECVGRQWVNKPERRNNQSKLLSNYRQTHVHPLLGCKRPDASERMKKNNPMADKDISDRTHKKIKELFQKEPERYGIYHKKLTQHEQIVFNLVKDMGFSPIGNELINEIGRAHV